jgi:hypothetical protein
MTIINHAGEEGKKFAVQQILTLLFPDYRVIITPRSLIFSKDETTSMVDDNNFELFQGVLKDVFC